MTNSDLIEKLASKHLQLTPKDVYLAIKDILDQIT